MTEKKVIETQYGWYQKNDDKVNVDEIIGIVKTDEQTNSVQLKKEAQLSICEKRVLELEKENEQLKAQLYCDDEEGVCNICKHHYLVKDDEAELGYYTSRCKKGHYECARVSLKYCDDFELEGDVE